MTKCTECGREIKADERSVPNPCCSAPDCENKSDRTHYSCLSRERQVSEDIYNGDLD